jgi:nitroimidazol reductase NimA-like FMN-containing flavoprotein (pyridoxamine 5'-phosphate oxidase superfamily)
MNELRRNDRAMPQDEALALLDKAEYGILSTVSENSEPYGVPLNFCFSDNSIYFHCARAGQKINHLEHNQKVSFCVVGKTQLLPAKFSTRYESVIVFGKAEEVFAAEKQNALEKLVRKYSADFLEPGKKYIEKSQVETRVFKLKISRLTGKARR